MGHYLLGHYLWLLRALAYGAVFLGTSLLQVLKEDPPIPFGTDNLLGHYLLGLPAGHYLWGAHNVTLSCERYE